ncbi:MAG: hypothetical protein R3293_24505 [Candidatus Promineifilaceae bacterium]|nr:hypothetical protein [Candidatus Promineifilaceae bacterium]
MRRQSRPYTVWALIGCLLFLSISGLAGGIGMLIDPSGASLALPADLLVDLPIDTFILPGLYLVVVYGLLSPVIAYGLWKRAPWAWGAAVVLSIILLGWIIGQLILWGSPHIIQAVYFVLGLAMLILSMVRGTRVDQQQRLPYKH